MIDRLKDEELKKKYTRLTNVNNIQEFFNISCSKSLLIKEYMQEIQVMLLVNNDTQQLYMQELSVYIREHWLEPIDKEQVYKIIKNRIEFKLNKLEYELELIQD